MTYHGAFHDLGSNPHGADTNVKTLVSSLVVSSRYPGFLNYLRTDHVGISELVLES